MKKVKAEESVGETLAYDITEVNIETGFKGCAFKRGQVIQQSDIEHLHRLGKNYIFVEDGNDDEVHENDAAVRVGELAAGENIKKDDTPAEGKISFYSTTNGIFKVDKDRLKEINILGIPSFPTIHNNFPVTEDYRVAAFRITPLTCPKYVFEKVEKILETPLISVKPYIYKTASLLVTGSEVHSGKIKDGFKPKLEPKLKKLGVELVNYSTCPDSMDELVAKMQEFTDSSDIVLVTGGTSVDPDDITTLAMQKAGIEFKIKGNPIQPGNNFTIGYKNNKPVCAIPAAALTFHATALDIFLPRLLAGEQPTPEEIAEQGHGGLCHFCKKCVFPVCPFITN